MTKATQAVGAYGERCASAALAEAGLVVLDRNWRCRDGELDIVARDGDAIVFCEVKTRRSDAYGVPAEAVTPSKAKRIRRLAARWLAGSGLHPREVRFDVLAVSPQHSGPAQVEHLRGVF